MSSIVLIKGPEHLNVLMAGIMSLHCSTQRARYSWTYKWQVSFVYTLVKL